MLCCLQNRFGGATAPHMAVWGDGLAKTDLNSQHTDKLHIGAQNQLQHRGIETKYNVSFYSIDGAPFDYVRI